jgi:hypothetical protein
MAKTIVIFIAIIGALSATAGAFRRPNPGLSQEQVSQTSLNSPERAIPERAIKVTIETVGSFLGPPTDHYKVGDQIPVAITLTNTTSDSQYACISADLYQNLPKLTKDGQMVPYMSWQSYERVNAQRSHTCEDTNLPETIMLRPNEPKMADWFVLADNRTSTGAEAWYDPLTPGRYELTIQRRFGCCDGPMIESNKISFEVVP